MVQNKPSLLTISLVGSLTLIFLLVICLYVAEIVLAVSRPATRSEALAKLRSEQVRSFPAVTPQVILLRNQLRGLGAGRAELVPLGGVANVQTVFCRETEEMIVYKSDRFGFRNDDALWDKPIDIVAIGDSYTQGACVADDSHFVGQLREHYENVLNLGSFGNGPYANLGVLTEYAAPKAPELILWFYVANDMAIDMNLEQGNRVLSQYLNPSFSQQLTQRQPEIDAALAPFLDGEWQRQKTDESRSEPNMLALGHVRQAIRQGLTGWLRPQAPDLPAEFDYDRQQTLDYRKHAFIVAHAAQRARQQGSKFAFVIVPDARMLRQDVANDQSPQRHVVRLKQSIAAMGVPVIDLYQTVNARQHPETLYSALEGYYGHFTPEGYGIVGDDLIKQVKTITDETHAGP